MVVMAIARNGLDVIAFTFFWPEKITNLNFGFHKTATGAAHHTTSRTISSCNDDDGPKLFEL